jgi:hypothetical protein
MKWATVIHTTFNKLAGDTSVPGQSLLQGRKAAVEALASPITASLISLSLIFPERIRIWKSYGSFETMTILPYARRIRPSLRQAFPCSCDGVLKQITGNQHLIFPFGIARGRLHYNEDNLERKLKNGYLP